MRNLTRDSVIPNTITGTKRRIIAVTVGNEPQLIKKYQNTLTQDMEEKILFMYAKGMTTGDIESHMKKPYDMDISDSAISRITDKILPIVKEWQENGRNARWRKSTQWYLWMSSIIMSAVKDVW